MSSSNFKISYEIIAVDSFSSTFDRFANATGGLDRAFGQMNQMGKTMIGMGTALGGSIVYAAQQAALFEREMSAVKAVSGATGSEFDRLSEKAREMGAKTSFSAHEAAEGMKYLSLAGWKTEEMLAGIEPILYLAEAGNMELGRAADLASDSMAGLGLKADQTEYYLDRIAQTSRNSNTNVTQLMEAFKVGGGSLANLNVPLEESNALFGVMANRGFKGAQAGRAMNAIIQNLTTGFGRAGKAMEEINVSAFDSQGNFRGLEATFRDIIKATKDMNEEDRNRIYAMIAGKEHIKTFNAILRGMGEEYDELKLKNINATGALAEMRHEMKNNLIGAVENLVSALKETAISFGELLLPVLTSATKGLTNIVTAFNETSASTKKAIMGIVAASSAFLILQGSVFTIFGTAGKLMLAFKTLGKSMLVVSAIGLSLSAVLAGVAVGGFMAYKKEADKALDTTVKFSDKVSDTTAEVVQGYQNMVQEVSASTRMYADGQIQVDEEVRTALLNGQEEFHNTSFANLKERHRKELERTEEHLAEVEGLTEADRQARLAKVNEHYENEKQSLLDSNQEIQEIIRTAGEQERALRESEIQRIEELRGEAQQTTLASIAESEEERLAILQAYKDIEHEMDAEQAAKTVQQSKEKYEALKEQAEEEFEEKLAWAMHARDVTGAISEEEAEKIIAEAKKQRDEVVGAAEDSHNRVVEAAKERAGENVALVNWETGEILSGWQLFLARYSGVWDKIKQVAESFKPVLEELKRAFQIFSDIALDAIEALAPSFSNMTSLIIDLMADLASGISERLTQIKQYWDENGEQILETVNRIMTAMEVVIRVTMTIIKFVVGGIWDSIVGIIRGALDLIMGLVNIFTGLFTGDWSLMWEGIKQATSGAIRLVINIFINGFFRKIGSLFKAFAGKALGSVKTLGTNLVSSISNLPGKFLQIGGDMIQGLINGVKRMMGAAVEAVAGVANSIIGAAKGILGIKSPSRVFKAIGRDVIRGYVVGHEENQDEAVQTTRKHMQELADIAEEFAEKELRLVADQGREMRKAIDSKEEAIARAKEEYRKKGAKATKRDLQRIRDVEEEERLKIMDMEKKHLEDRNKLREDLDKAQVDHMKAHVKEMKELGRMRLDDEIRFWNEMRKISAKGSEQERLAIEEHQSTVKELREKLVNINEEYTGKMKEIDENHVEETKKINKEYEDALKDRYDSYRHFNNIFDGVKREEIPKMKPYFNLVEQAQALDEFEWAINNLDKRIDNKKLVNELRAQGVKSVDQLVAITEMTESELAGYVRLYEEFDKKAMEMARYDSYDDLLNKESALSKLKDKTSKELYDVQWEWENAISDIVRVTKKEFDSMQQVGVDAIAGLEMGMKSKEGDVYKVAEDIAYGVSYVIADALKIKSPSRVMMGFGEFIGEGLVVGMKDSVGRVKRQAEELVNFAKPKLDVVELELRSGGGIESLLNGDKDVYMTLDDRDLVRALEGLSERMEDFESLDGSTVNVTIDGKTVATMSHVEEFFSKVEQEVKRRKR